MHVRSKMRLAGGAAIPLALRSAFTGLPARLPSLMTPGALLLVYVVLEWVSSIHEYKGVPVTPWNPGLGVLFSVLVLRGPRYGLVLFAGVVTAELFVLRTDLAWPVIVAMAALIATTYAAAAALARRHLRLDVGLSHVQDVLVLLAAGAAAAATSASLVSVLLIVAGELSIADLMQASLPLLVGDIIGIAVVTPLLLRLSARWPDLAPRAILPLLPEFLLHLAVIGLTLWIAVGADGASDHKRLSALFLPVLAAALRRGIDGSCAALAATQLGLVTLLHQYGYDAAAFTEFQIVMLVLTMSGLLVGVVVSERERADLAARHAEERLKDLQAQAGQAARINLVSGMASALAHELNQPITAARALARSVQQILDSPDADRERADKNLSGVISQIDHAGGVVRRMREFLRRGQPHFSTLDVGQVLEDALVLASANAAANRVSIALEIGDGIPVVFGDRIQLQQVILNLAHNAVEAIVEARRSDGQIRIVAQRSPREPAVEIRVSDNGGGIPEGLRLFEPLVSSKASGLGLGLSICASIVQAHGGRIWLHASDPEGTEFRLSLPIQLKDGS